MRDEDSSVKGIVILVGIVCAIVLCCVLLFGGFFAFVSLKGNEVAVVQNWQGVKNEILVSGMHFYNNFIDDVFVYDIGTQKITFDEMNTKSVDYNPDAEYPRILMDIGENGGQKVTVGMSVNYHLNPAKIVTLHKQGIGKTYESVVLKREIIDVVNEIARPRNALEIYSGSGFVKFKMDVEKALESNPVLKDRGLEIENTIIYKIHLDPQYENEIAQKQIAQQQALRKQEETKAAQEEAKKIFAQGQSVVEKARQEAEASKVSQITNAEANARQEVLKAEAEKAKRVLEAEGNRDANLANASGVLALGKAEAEVATLKRDALYAGESGSRKASVEIAGLQAEKLKGMLNGCSVISEKALYNMGKATGMYTVSVDDKKTE